MRAGNSIQTDVLVKMSIKVSETENVSTKGGLESSILGFVPIALTDLSYQGQTSALLRFWILALAV